MEKTISPTVFITGCSSGIGLALAREFKRRGYVVFATAMTVKEVDFLKKEGMEIGACDVRSSASIKTCVKTALKKLVRIDVLVNNAGIGVIGPAAELTTDDMRRQFETNFFGACALAGEVLPDMMDRRSGIIINMGSVSGVLATPFAGAYCASKAALHAWSDSLRVELRPFNVRVITVQPGAVRTNWGITAAKELGRFYRKSSHYAPMAEAIEARAKTHLENPTGVKEVAAAIVDAVRTGKNGILRIGNESRKLPFLKWLLPRGLLDGILYKRFGLSRLEGR
jgi:NAD(P)-dependent dehydrogenase (short-subunit alcohol dehydrogenase family)